eukprot:5590490-Pyramimonas_sp.AAC.1
MPRSRHSIGACGLRAPVRSSANPRWQHKSISLLSFQAPWGAVPWPALSQAPLRACSKQWSV